MAIHFNFLLIHSSFRLCKMFLTGLIVAAAIYLALRLSGYFRGGKCRATTSLAGQVAVITGANTGIGLETAMDFIRRGVSTLIIGCR